MSQKSLLFLNTVEKQTSVPILLTLLHSERPNCIQFLTPLHSERPKLYTILAFLSAKGLKQIGKACILDICHKKLPISLPFPCVKNSDT